MSTAMGGRYNRAGRFSAILVLYGPQTSLFGGANESIGVDEFAVV